MKSAKYFLRLKKPSYIIIRRIKGKSMEPLCKEGTLVFASSLIRPKINKIIIFNNQGIQKIKLVNKIMDNRLYVLGLNKNQSTDSRDFGWINKEDVIAVIFFIKKKLIKK